jgi:hypothetical protein
MNIIKGNNRALGKKLEELENNAFAPGEVSVLCKKATEAQRAFAKIGYAGGLSGWNR